MKALLKITAHFTFFCIITGAACTETPITADSQSILGRWQLYKVIVNDSVIGKPSPYKGRNEVEIEFLAQDRIFGTTSSNNYSGTYQVKEPDSLSVIYVPGSKVREIRWGEYFLHGLLNVKSFKIVDGSLVLNFKERDKLFFKKIIK
jgi:hypothetical protein